MRAGQGASAAALIAGFARHDPALPLAGIVFNRVAGPRHRAVLEAALARHLPDLPCLGGLPQDPELALPERHLGLVPAGEKAAAERVITRAATRLRRVSTSIGWSRSRALRRLPVPHRPPDCRRWATRIAIARDEAFLFAYPAVLEGWRRQGAELSFFSPLADEIPDAAADAIYLPGGYPELHAGRLAAAERFAAALRRAAAVGIAIYGECGGYMALGESLIDSDGCAHRMAGLLPLSTSFAERRLHLGYREATLLGAGPLGPAGARFQRARVPLRDDHRGLRRDRSSRSPIPAGANSARAGCGTARSSARSST